MSAPGPHEWLEEAKRVINARHQQHWWRGFYWGLTWGSVPTLLWAFDQWVSR